MTHCCLSVWYSPLNRYLKCLQFSNLSCNTSLKRVNQPMLTLYSLYHKTKQGKDSNLLLKLPRKTKAQTRSLILRAVFWSYHPYEAQISPSVFSSYKETQVSKSTSAGLSFFNITIRRVSQSKIRCFNNKVKKNFPPVKSLAMIFTRSS